MECERCPRAYAVQYTAVMRLGPHDVTCTERTAREPYRLVLISVGYAVAVLTSHLQYGLSSTYLNSTFSVVNSNNKCM